MDAVREDLQQHLVTLPRIMVGVMARRADHRSRQAQGPDRRHFRELALYLRMALRDDGEKVQLFGTLAWFGWMGERFCTGAEGMAIGLQLDPGLVGSFFRREGCLF